MCMFRMGGYCASLKAKREQEIVLTLRRLAREVLESQTHWYNFYSTVSLEHSLVCSHTSLALPPP